MTDPTSDLLWMDFGYAVLMAQVPQTNFGVSCEVNLEVNKKTPISQPIVLEGKMGA